MHYVKGARMDIPCSLTLCLLLSRKPTLAPVCYWAPDINKALSQHGWATTVAELRAAHDAEEAAKKAEAHMQRCA